MDNGRDTDAGAKGDRRVRQNKTHANQHLTHVAGGSVCACVRRGGELRRSKEL